MKEINDAIEPERYELFAAPSYLFRLDRREFFKSLGGGLVIALIIKDAAAQESGGGRAGRPQAPQDISAWLRIAKDNSVTVYTGKVEFGQNIRTSLAQAVADELRAPLSNIKLVMGDTDLTPFDMGTFGSMTTPVMSAQLRKASAAARKFLIDLAVNEMKADRAQLTVADGKITDASGRSMTFGQLVGDQKITRAIAANVTTTPADRWTVAGRSVRKVDGRAFVTGKHKFTSDMKLEGMLYGKVLRSPSIKATLASCDIKEAQATGAIVVRDGDFVGVAAATPHTAERALSLIRAEWKATLQPSRRELFDYLKTHPAQQGRRSEPFVKGNIEEALASADKKLEASYTVHYIAHVPLEPRAALAQWQGDKLTVWTATQRPFGVRSELAQAFRIPDSQVRVIVPDTGSGYGGKHTGETAIEAARLARAAARPVKLVWTREEEFTWGYFRPAGVIDIRSGVSKDGMITAWEFHNYNSGPSAIRPLYDIANQKIEFHPADSPLRQGSYRALAATANHFAREMHIDELSRAVGLDPLEFRYRNLKDARLRAVLDAAAGAFGWSKRKSSQGRGFGIAGGMEKGSYIAMCAEVAVSNGRVKVVRVAAAFECGAVVNPDGLRNQIEGSIVMGLGGALFEAVDFENGKILNPRLSRYRVPRFSDVPVIEIVLVDRKDLPSAGAGETPIVALAPALGSAIFDATGVRLRSLPMIPNGTVK
ncbi:MAG: molybdopterin cofactor-binding domain-containing protein [Acidobacteriota bacterium]